MSDTTNLAVEHLFTLTAKTNVSAVIANGRPAPAPSSTPPPAPSPAPR